MGIRPYAGCATLLLLDLLLAAVSGCWTADVTSSILGAGGGAGCAAGCGAARACALLDLLDGLGGTACLSISMTPSTGTFSKTLIGTLCACFARVPPRALTGVLATIITVLSCLVSFPISTTLTPVTAGRGAAGYKL